MQLSFLLFAFCFLLFLICLYIFGHDDFTLLRKNVSMEKVFDLSFVTAIVGLFFARLFYVIFHFDLKFLNPFIFLLFPYHPGLSLAGGIVGAFLFLFLVVRNPKMQAFRLLDFFALSFIFALPFGFLIQGLLILCLVFAVLFGILIYIFRKVKMEDGSMSLLVLISFSLVSLIVNIIEKWKNFSFLSQMENLLLTFILFASLAIFVREEKLLQKIKKLR